MAKGACPLSDASGGGSECELARAVFELAGQCSGFDPLLFYEVADKHRAAEALERGSPTSSSFNELNPEVVPLGSVYPMVGGDRALVEPALCGEHMVVCTYG